VTVKGSQRDGYTSHIEKVLLPNGVEDTSAAIKAQPEGLDAVIRFIVTVNGSPSDGYTTEIEELKPPKVLTEEEQKKAIESLKLRRGSVIATVQKAGLTAEKAASHAVNLLRLLYNIGTNINTNETKEAGDTINAMDEAVTAAENAVNAVENAEDAIKAKILNEDIAVMLENAMTMSNEANALMKNAVGDMKDKTEVNRPLRDKVIEAKKAVEQAMYKWKEIHKIMISLSTGGYRNHTYRNHKKRKHKTIRKS
jgi:hypothetical protein